MTSPEKAAANRNNAKKSTGPKTIEGKARSARNAVTHGLTANPGEPTEAYQEYLREWIADLKSKGMAERTLAERACRAAWNLKQCDRYEDAIAAKRHRDAAEMFALAEATKAETTGRRLIAVPVVNGSGEAPTGYARPDDDDPAALVGALRTTAAGVAWMLARWAELDRALKEPAGWDDARKFAAVRLLGLRPESARDHPLARRILPPSVDGGPGSGSPFNHPAMDGALEAAVAAKDRGEGDVPTLYFGLWKAVVARDRGEARSEPAAAKLKALVRSERAKLARLLRRVLKDRAAEDRAGAADRSLFDDSRSLSLCLRYGTAASRDLHRAITDLAKLRKAAGDEGYDEAPDTPPAEPGPAGWPALRPGESPTPPEQSSPGDRVPTPATEDSEELRNEATVALPVATPAGHSMASRKIHFRSDSGESKVCHPPRGFRRIGLIQTRSVWT